MHHFEDASKVKEFVARKKGQKAVIIGAGLIGVEMAEAFRAQGMEVAIVEMLPTVMGLLLDEEMGKARHEAHGAEGCRASHEREGGSL